MRGRAFRWRCLVLPRRRLALARRRRRRRRWQRAPEVLIPQFEPDAQPLRATPERTRDGAFERIAIGLLLVAIVVLLLTHRERDRLPVDVQHIGTGDRLLPLSRAGRDRRLADRDEGPAGPAKGPLQPACVVLVREVRDVRRPVLLARTPAHPA